MHINAVHSNLKPFQCEKCDKCFSQNVNLQMHIDRVHSKLKPFQCEKCEKCYADNRDLKTHIHRKHSKTNPLKKYVFTECEESFEAKERLDYHMNSVHQN